MKFDKKDIEAVAKSRIMRAEGNKGMYWMIASLVAIVVGAVVTQTSVPLSWALIIGGAGVFYWRTTQVSKKQKDAAVKLVREWQQEQAK